MKLGLSSKLGMIISNQGLPRAVAVVQPGRSLFDVALRPLRHQHGPIDRAGVPPGFRQSWWCRSRGRQVVDPLDESELSHLIDAGIYCASKMIPLSPTNRRVASNSVMAKTGRLLHLGGKVMTLSWTTK